MAPAQLDQLWSEVARDTIDAKRSWLTRARELPTALRIALVVVGSIGISTLALLVVGGVRGDMVAQSLVGRHVLAMVGLAVLATTIFAVALRGVHRRPLGLLGWAAVALGVIIPLGLSLTPWVWQSASGPSAETIHGCNVIGTVTGLFAAGFAWLFQRTSTPAPLRLIASAAGGGVVAFGMLQLHCPSDDIEHLLLGHSIVGIILVGAALVFVGVRRLVLRRA